MDFAKPMINAYYGGMDDESNIKKIKNRRRSFGSLILLAILGGSVAIAAWLANHRGEPVRQGIEILDEIRKEGLSSYWPATQEQLQWFLIRKGQVNVGWRVVYRRKLPGETSDFGGGMIFYSSDGPKSRHAASKWRLTNDANKGLYTSMEGLLSRPPHLRAQSFTRIELLGGELKNGKLPDGEIFVTQRMGQHKHDSHAGMPGNYIPEGLTQLVLRQVAQRQTHAKFKIIIDSQPPDQGRIIFFTQEMEYIGPATNHPTAVIVETRLFTPSGQAMDVQLYTIEPNGKILKRTHGNIEEVAVSQEEVVKAFPEAEQIFQNTKGRNNTMHVRWHGDTIGGAMMDS
ncbi:MAG: hypothetical protein K8S55_15400 [Phycisphaerae bacterium]|nr:hypothetical protein [Phycisphaerae bacterium]